MLRSTRGGSTALTRFPPSPRAIVVLVLCAAVALVAQFGLDDWASQSELGDWVQHGLLFWAGIGAGGALVVLYRSGQDVL